MRDKARQLITKKVESKLEVMYLDNFVGLDCVDVGLNMDGGTVLYC